MTRTNCLLQLKKTIKFVVISLSFVILTFTLLSTYTYSAPNTTINVEGKIVRNDAGYEGMNVTTGTPTCVIAGNSNDTCDFQVKYYSATTSGTLFLTETFENVEIGQYNGAFNLSLGSGFTVSGSHSSLTSMIQSEDSIYLEISFSPLGNGNYTEVFSRMPLQASAYSIRSQYSSRASGAFQFSTSSDSSGYSSPSAGMVYFDTTSNTLKIYNGSSWENISSGSSGTNLWTDAGAYTYLTDSTDSFSLGSTTYTPIGSSTYSNYLLGLTSNAPFSFDTPTERLSIAGDKQQSGLTVFSNYSGDNAWPLVTFQSNSVNFSSAVLNVVQGGTGKLATFYKGSTEAFSFENDQTFKISQRTGNPSTTADRLYNVGGVLYWNGSSICTLASGCGSSSLWTDGGTYTYLTSTTDNVVIGGDSASTAKFFFDVTNGRLGIGTSSPGARLDIGGADAVLSNSSGDFTILPAESLVVKANDSNPDNLQEWQNSLGTVLSLMNKDGYASLGMSTAGNAILNIGDNTGTVPQVNLASSNGIDVLGPSSGDLWWNGTNLYFFDGVNNNDLLSDGIEENVAYGLTANNGYLNLNHNLDTYSLTSEGYVCVGGTNDEKCTGGSWTNIDTFATSVTHTADSDWTGTSSYVNVNTGDLELAEGDSGMYISQPISTAGAKDYGDVSWNEQLGSTGKISVQTRSGNVEDRGPYRYMTDGAVHAQQLSPDGKTLYIGGNFTTVFDKYHGSSVMISKDTGELVGTNCPTIDRKIHTSVPDGNGGFYIGGEFTSVGGVTRNRLAHINADCSLDMDFDVGVSGFVYALVLSGSTLYVGGGYGWIGGAARNCLAAIDITTKTVTSFDPNVNDNVYTLLLDGTTLYIGGYFTGIGSDTRNRIGAVNTTTGAVITTFNPNADGEVRAFALSGTTLYVGGGFTNIGSQTKNYFAALDTSTGLATAFNFNANAYVKTLLLDNNTLYVGGNFTTIGGQGRKGLASIDITGAGTLNGFNPDANGCVLTMVLNGGVLYVGGEFTTIGGQSRNRIGAVDASTGSVTSFNPNANNAINTLTLSGSTFYVGGVFTSINGKGRNRLAAINTETGLVSSFNPSPNAVVYGLLLCGTTLYVGGEFTSIGGQSLRYLVAVDTDDGTVITTFNPNVNYFVRAIVSNGTLLYFGGDFTKLGTTTRNRIAAVNMSDGALVTAFNPDSNNIVRALVLDGSVLYVGGSFTNIGAQARNYIAALNVSDGTAITTFNPSASGIVHALALGNNVLYVGGQFTSIAGTSRTNLAALNTSDGTATTFDTTAGSIVRALFLSGDTLYVGGQFNKLGGLLKNMIGAVNINTGVVADFNPNANGFVRTIIVDGTTVYAGGDFTSIGGQNNSYVAPIDFNTSQVVVQVVNEWSNWEGGNKISLNNSDNHYSWNGASFKTDGLVRSHQLSADGKILYIGGDFTAINPIETGGGAKVDKHSGELLGDNCAVVNGSVYTSVPDGSGGYYIGGSFTSISGVTRNGLAHINPDCSLDMDFNANANGYSAVRTMVLSGSTLYIGGQFTNIGGESRNNIAGIDTTTGTATSLSLGTNSYSNVYAMLLDANTLYVGGGFTKIGSNTRNNIGAIDVTGNSGAGIVTSFNPNADSTVYTMILDGSTLYVGGSFTTIGSDSRKNIAAINTSTGLATSFSTYVNSPYGRVRTMILEGNTLYVGGAFYSLGGESRNCLAAIDVTGNGGIGAVTSFNPNANSTVHTMVLDGTTLYIGGAFTTVGGQYRNNLTAVDTSSGLMTNFYPNIHGLVSTLALSGGAIYVGGEFTVIGGEFRNKIAAIDTTTGLTTGFNPGANNTVFTLLLDGTTLYAGGMFTSIGGLDRNKIAAIDTTTGTVTTFNPNATSGQVETLLLNGNTLYVGGSFDTIGGESRNCLAAIDTSTGLTTSFNPNVGGNVFTMVLNDTTLYIGGHFTSIGGEPRNRLGAVDTVTGLPTAFNPDANSFVQNIILDGTTLYVGGVFTKIGSDNRKRIAAIDVTGNEGVGTVTGFNPNITGGVETMVLDDNTNTLYIGAYLGNNTVEAINTTTSMVRNLNSSLTASTLGTGNLFLHNNTLFFGSRTLDKNTGLLLEPTLPLEGDISREVENFEDENELDVSKITKVSSSEAGQYISSRVDLSSSPYDYITLWICSNQVGYFELHLGTDAISSIIYKYIFIDNDNTWEKKYIDISDIPDNIRSQITHVRLVNTSTEDSHVFYVDNLNIESLPSNKAGFEITNPVDTHIQYRVIFTNTDDTSQPKLEDITLTYNTQYAIVYEDSNNIRLYNYSGSDQYLRLEVNREDVVFVSNAEDGNGVVAFSFNTTNTLTNPTAKLLSVKNGGSEKMYLDANGNLYVTGEVFSSKGKYLHLAPKFAQVDNIDNSNSIWINKTGVGGNLVSLQSNGSDKFVVNSSGNLVMSGTAQVDGGELKLGSNGNIRFNGTTNTLEMSKDGGSTWVAVGDSVGKIVLSAEYSGSVLSADGTNNIGNMTSDNMGTTYKAMNYYEWSSSELSLNDYDIRVRVTLPSDFDSWGDGGITIHYATESTSSTNNKLDVYVFEQSQSVVDGQSENLVSSTAGVWGTSTISGSTLDQCTDKGTTCIVNLKLSSLGDNYVRVGNIILNYTRVL